MLIPGAELFEEGLAEYFAHGFEEYDDATKEYIECYIDCLKQDLSSGKTWNNRIHDLTAIKDPSLMGYIFSYEEENREAAFSEAWYYGFIKSIASNSATPQETKEAIKEILESERDNGFTNFVYHWSEEQVEECIRICE